MAAHGWSLGGGLLLDDHWHQARLREMGWSIRELFEATTLEPDRFIDAWWQQRPAVWRYSRPVSVFLMKVVHEVWGGSVGAHHAVSLLLHFAVACMVHQLCLLLTHDRFWSAVGGLLFVVYSHGVFAVSWLAAQNTVLQTALMVGALLCYIRASRLYVGPVWHRFSTRTGCPIPSPPMTPGATGGSPASASDGRQHGQASCPWHPGNGSSPSPTARWARDGAPAHPSPTAKAMGHPLRPPPFDQNRRMGHPHSAFSIQHSSLNRTAFAWTLVLWVLALFSRENAVMLPAIMLAFDLAFCGKSHVWARRRVYLLVGAMAAAFLYWRLVVFHQPMPDVYFRRPDGDGYLLWWVAKLLHYLCSSVWLSPMTVGPTGRINPFDEVPGDCLLMIGILAVMGAGYFLASRNARGFWIWPLWLLLAVLPVVPVLATPHSGYLGGVAFAVAMVLGPGLGRGARWYRPVALWFLVATSAYIPIYRTLWQGMIAAERFTISEMTAEPPPDGVTDIFLLNLPFVNIYSQLCLTEAWGEAMSGVRCHVLTYAPELLRMEQPCTLRQHDANSFSVSVEGRPYFSGLLGRFLVEGLRRGGPFKTGDVFPGEQFDVRIVRTGESPGPHSTGQKPVSHENRGVRELRFTFHEPLASDRYWFYLTTPQCGALRVTFAGAGARATDSLPGATGGSPASAMADNPPVAPGESTVALPHPSPREGWDPPQHRPATVEEPSVSLHNVLSAGQRLSSGESAAAEVLFAAIDLDDSGLRRRAWVVFARVAAPLARATGAALGDYPARDEPPVDWRRVRDWWRRLVDDRLVDRVWVHRDDFAAIRRTRDALFKVRSIATSIIQTDLYLTGPPFPGPR